MSALKVMWLLAALMAVSAASVTSTPCVQARTRCAYRTGCGAALSNYMMMCEPVLSEPSKYCPKECSHALIALTSTEEGKELMNCECGDDEFCIESKTRIDICRPQVLREAENATSSCTLSQLICIANAQCATALSYYHQFCRSMFRGRKCSNKCLNSIEILRKQEKAAALTVCQCDGNEDYNCPRMQSNLERLCFHKKGHGRGHGRDHEKHKKVPKEPISDSASTTAVSWLILMSALLLSFNT